MWTYGIQLWGPVRVRPNNIEIIQTYQLNILRTINGTTWYVINQVLHEEKKVPTVKTAF